MAGLIQLIKKGQSQFAAGDAAASVATLRRAVEEFPDDPKPLIQLLRALLDLRELEPARGIVDKMQERFADHSPCQLYCGRFYFADGDLERAIGCFQRCLELQKENLIAKSYFLLSKWASVRDWPALDQLLSMPECSNLDFFRDFCVTAETYLVGLAPDPAPLAESCGIEAGGADKPDTENTSEMTSEAAVQAATQKLAAADQALIQKNLKRAIAHFEKREYRQALEQVEALRAKFPDEPQVVSAMAEALYAMYRFDEAEDYFRRTVAEEQLQLLDVDERGFLQSAYGYVLIRNKRFAAAWEILKRVKPFGPEDYMGFYMRGICLILLEDGAAGRRELNRAWGEYQYNTKHQCLARLREELSERCRVALDKNQNN